MAGFVKLEQAGEAEKAQDPSLALDLYRAALEAFVTVRAEFPRWNPSLLDYRVNYCNQRIERLGRDLASSSQALTVEQLRKLTAELREKAGRLAFENLKLRKELSLTSSSLERARTEAARRAAAGAETEELVRENALLRKTLLAREQELREASARLKAMREETGLGQAEGELKRQLALALAAQARLEREQEAVELAYRTQTERLKQAVIKREEYGAQKEALVRAAADKELSVQEKGRRLDEAEAELAELRQGLKRTAQELERAREAKDEEAAQAKVLEAELESLRTLRDRFVAGTEENRGLHSKVRTLLEKQAGLQASNTRLEDQNTAFVRDIEEAQRTVAAKQKAEAEAQASFAEERAGLQLKLQEATARAEAVDAARKAAQEIVAGFAEQLRAAKQANAALEASLAEAGKRGGASEAGARETAVVPDRPMPSPAQGADAGDRGEARVVRPDAETTAPDPDGPRGVHAEARAELERLAERLGLERSVRRELEANLKTASVQAARASGSATRVRELEKQCAGLAEELEETRKVRLTQDKALASADERIRELSAIAAQIQAKEQDARTAATRADEAERRLEAVRVKMAKLEQDADLSGAERKHAEQMLDALQTRNRELVAENEARGKRQTANAEARKELTGQLSASTERADKAETRREELSAQLEEQLALLRKQEERLRAVETEAAALREQARASGEGGDIKALLAKAEVVDGLRDSLRQTDRALDQTRERLRQALTRLEHGRQRIEGLDERIAEKTTEVETLQRALAAERRDRDAGAKLLTVRLTTLTERLERETERCRALEKTIEERDVATASTPEKRERPSADHLADDRQLLVRGFLTQGYAAEKTGAVEAVTWNYGRALEADPESLEALKRLGRIHADRRDDDRAVEYLTRAFHQTPDDVDVLVPLGYALVNLKQADLAVSMLSRAVALKPKDAATHSILGVALTSLGWTQAAEVQFRRAFALDKEDSQTAFNLAVLLATQSATRTQEAREWYELSRKLGAEADPGLDRYFGL